MKKTLLMLFVSITTLSALTADPYTDHQFSWKEVDFSEINGSEYSSNSYKYFTLGTGPICFIPNFGVGYRGRDMYHGFDVSLSASTLVEAHILQASALYHFFPNPHRQDPWYLGLGAAANLYLVNYPAAAGGFSPDFVVGKELYRNNNTKHFVEAHVQAPLWVGTSLKQNRMGRINFPMMYIKYGASF